MISLQRKKVTEAQENVQGVQTEFTKEQILAASKYADRRDLVNALLDDKKRYTMKMVDEAISKYMKGQVK